MNKQIFCIIFIAVCVLCSCDREDVNDLLAKEDQKLTEYVGLSATQITDGLYMKKTKSINTGSQSEAGKQILVNYTLTLLYDDKLERTSDKSLDGRPIYYPLYREGGPELWYLPESFSGVLLGIEQMYEGEKAIIYFTSRNNNVFYPYVDFNTRVLQIEVVKTIGDITDYQESLMNTYLTTYGKKIDTLHVQSTIDNQEYKVMFCVLDEGTGEPVTTPTYESSWTKFGYILYEGNDRSYSPVTEKKWNTLTTTKCIEEILSKITKNGEVVITMPYLLYYGNTSDQMPYDKSTGQIIVPMNSVLIFKIKLSLES